MLGRLYVILDSSYVDEGDMLKVCEKILKGGADILQLRAKDWEKGKIKKVAQELFKLCSDHNVPLIINDHPDIGVLFSGAHIGKEDMPFEKAKEILKEKILGVSCYDNLELALNLQEKGVSYVAFSSPYPSPTKEKELSGFELFERAKEVLRIPFYAIGGIDEERAREMIRHGAYGVAVVSAILKAKDVEDATRRIRDAIYSSI